jgi:Holliday junction resolvase RusA-like endonuclease
MIVLDLPMPPSVNRIWRRRGGGGMYLAKEYQDWINRANNFLLAQKCKINGRQIKGRFELTLTISDRQRRGDLDNRLKTVLDFCQRVNLIENDKHAERIVLEWGNAPEGCRVRLAPFVSRADPPFAVAPDEAAA